MGVVLFDERPKESVEDFYNYEEELESFTRALRAGAPMILILAPRRYGKTSLLKVGLSEAGLPNIFIDCRVFESEPGVSRAHFISILEGALNSMPKPLLKSLANHLRGVQGVELMGIKIRLSWHPKRAVGLPMLMDAIDEWAGSLGQRVVIAFDEAQLLRRVGWARLDYLFAHMYDNHRNTTLVMTGSQVGLLQDFLGVGDPEAPLYGRPKVNVVLRKLPRNKALEFLRMGFEEQGVRVEERLLEGAVDRLDGVIGWLTFFGSRAISAVRMGAEINDKLVGEVLEEAYGVALAELRHFLRNRPAKRRYMTILRALAAGIDRWSLIKRHLEAREGRPITDPTIADLLKTLQKTGIVKRENQAYRIADPILEQALRHT